MALSYFAKEATDVAVMEVGMGGRLDSTNVIMPLAAAITNISMEHQQYLGSRLMDIAFEKGGVIKEGIDVITGVTQPSVLDLYRSTCMEKGARLWRLGKDIRYRTTASGLHYYGPVRHMEGLSLALRGSFQSRNAAVALGVIELLSEKGFVIEDGHVRDGLKNTFWPGRMHLIAREPALVLDGSHNPGAIRTIVSTLDRDFSYRRLFVVVGIMADKDISAMLREIVPIADYVIYTRPVYDRAADPRILCEKAKGLGAACEVIPSLPSAIEKARELADSQDLILVCGSLFTVGEALTHLDPVTYKPDFF
jgi:dihydrofolate synthase/folylpolyglutamate synthase